jgi:hypothetical protein
MLCFGAHPTRTAENPGAKLPYVGEALYESFGVGQLVPQHHAAVPE